MIDLRSDTVTKPTDAMRRAMAAAEVGDDVYGEDPTINRLQEMAAERTGKEAGLFVTSGTQGNQVALRVLTRPGDNVIAEEGAHLLLYEFNAGALASVRFTTLAGRRGALDLDEVRTLATHTTGFTNDTSHVSIPAKVKLVCLENTHNRASGAVYPIEEMRAISRFAGEEIGANVYLDGARIFNASVASGVSVADYAACADLMSFCFSKGLCAPVGSMLVGSKDAIAEARIWRKRFGGGMRQAGVLAAAGIVALGQMVDRLAEDHANARRLAEGLAGIEPKAIDLDAVETNIVTFEAARVGRDMASIMEALRTEGVLTSSVRPGAVRMLTHNDVGQKDVDAAISAYAKVLK